jgi:hypothetical protein
LGLNKFFEKLFNQNPILDAGEQPKTIRILKICACKTKKIAKSPENTRNY